MTRFPIVLLILSVSLVALSLTVSAQEFASPIRVELKNTAGVWSLTRDGQPYTIRGAGGPGSLKLLAECGANSNRTWGADAEIRAQLDEAHRHGLSVAVGIWLEHPSPKFDYNNLDHVAGQIDNVLAAVRRFKNHPAVLVWGIGNEMEGAAGDNPAIWSHVEHLAQLIKAEDPNHPTMSVIAEIGGRKIEAINKLCPSLDIVGINSYGGARSLAERYRAAGGFKPYVVTEFGPVGTWEVPKNEFGAIEEPTSTEKAIVYRDVYQKIVSDNELCLGCYAFLWGEKQEGTKTWFGLLLPDGNKTSAVDSLIELWSGKAPKNQCPVIESVSVSGPRIVQPGSTMGLEVKASDPEHGELTVSWKMLAEADAYVTGGFFQETPPEISKSFAPADQAATTVTFPAQPGLYRIYVTVDDGHQASAVANVVFKVAKDQGATMKDRPENSTVTSKKDNPSSVGQTVRVSADKLPFVVFDEEGNSDSFTPSGWMGNTSALEMKADCRDEPFAGEVCLQCDYKSRTDWAGVVWQSPANDWGDLDGGFDLTVAKKLTFRAKGSAGNEKITFGVGVIGREKPFFDSSKTEVVVTLSQEWQAFTIDLSEADRGRIKSGFWFSVAGVDEPIRFFLDQIQFEGE